jgi:hypothetical protein
MGEAMRRSWARSRDRSGPDGQQKGKFGHPLHMLGRLLGAGLHHLAQGQDHLALGGDDFLVQEQIAQGHANVSAQNL